MDKEYGYTLNFKGVDYALTIIDQGLLYNPLLRISRQAGKLVTADKDLIDALVVKLREIGDRGFRTTSFSLPINLERTLNGADSIKLVAEGSSSMANNGDFRTPNRTDLLKQLLKEMDGASQSRTAKTATTGSATSPAGTR